MEEKFYNLYICTGIFFNHESYYRGETFVTKKITMFVAKYYKTQKGVLYLGSLSSKRDWGSAEDYVYGIWLTLQQSTPRDYLLATGVQTSIREFVSKVLTKLGYNLKLN